MYSNSIFTATGHNVVGGKPIISLKNLRHYWRGIPLLGLISVTKCLHFHGNLSHLHMILTASVYDPYATLIHEEALTALKTHRVCFNAIEVQLSRCNL